MSYFKGNLSQAYFIFVFYELNTYPLYINISYREGGGAVPFIGLPPCSGNTPDIYFTNKTSGKYIQICRNRLHYKRLSLIHDPIKSFAILLPKSIDWCGMVSFSELRQHFHPLHHDGLGASLWCAREEKAATLSTTRYVCWVVSTSCMEGV